MIGSQLNGTYYGRKYYERCKKQTAASMRNAAATFQAETAEKRMYWEELFNPYKYIGHK